ncbi:hypothetical protein RCL1_007928 [Eukaryota sp. TZLM3-RCL]
MSLSEFEEELAAESALIQPADDVLLEFERELEQESHRVMSSLDQTPSNTPSLPTIDVTASSTTIVSEDEDAFDSIHASLDVESLLEDQIKLAKRLDRLQSLVQADSIEVNGAATVESMEDDSEVSEDEDLFIFDSRSL